MDVPDVLAVEREDGVPRRTHRFHLDVDLAPEVQSELVAGFGPAQREDVVGKYPGSVRSVANLPTAPPPSATSDPDA